MNRAENAVFIVALTSLIILRPADSTHIQAQSIPSSPDPTSRSETFYQQVEIQRLPRFSIQGMLLNQQIRYRIHSTFELYPPDTRGHRIAKQTILDTFLLESDPLSRTAFEQSLIRMRGLCFTYELDKFSKVISMKNQRDSSEIVEVENPRSRGMLVTTVIDEDGWKELAQLTLFQPPVGRSARQFSRKTTHDWDALGSWYGKTDFVGRPAGKNRRRFDYQHTLEYQPPDASKPIRQKLPFEIQQADFKTYEAFGQIFYDTKQKRVSSAQEVFHAKGIVTAKMFGVATNVELQERQIFQIEVTAQRVLQIPDSKRSAKQKE